MALILLALCCVAVHAASNATNATNHFISPASVDSVTNLVWQTGRAYDVQWLSSTEQAYNITFYQQFYSPSVYPLAIKIILATDAPTDSSTASITYNWTCQLYDANLTAANTFYFELRNDEVTIASNFFNITKDALPSSSTTSSAIVTSTTVSSSASTTSLPNSSSVVPSTNNSSSIDGLSIGLGVGLGILGALLVGLGLAFLAWRKRRRNRAAKDDIPSAWSPDITTSDKHGQVTTTELDTSRCRYELPPETVMAEAPARQALKELPANQKPAELDSSDGKA